MRSLVSLHDNHRSSLIRLSLWHWNVHNRKLVDHTDQSATIGSSSRQPAKSFPCLKERQHRQILCPREFRTSCFEGLTLRLFNPHRCLANMVEFNSCARRSRPAVEVASLRPRRLRMPRRHRWSYGGCPFRMVGRRNVAKVAAIILMGPGRSWKLNWIMRFSPKTRRGSPK